MSDDEASQPEKPRKKLKKLVIPLVAAILGAVGFCITYLGLVPLSAAKPDAVVHEPAVEFVDIPTIQLPVPGNRRRMVILSAAIETDHAYRAEIEHLMPRVQDAFTSFLSGIDETAYDKRGVLEIIRAELVTRTRYVLGDEPVKDLLITEFRIK
ncbi:flagellar basal body-associated FliL family protein [Paracoccus methylarcula]|uniref:Flagellar protein FliL n=1 Tax=Paracoccus methylarcula TaxID=72022 RepID=A0A422QSG2_9RHOB|nr:flagellar basal body-associated FliL family protein [Paracoccus methylarcula]RNF32913.1 flagellar basal body protein FliL [Paracoccus methylarcula]